MATFWKNDNTSCFWYTNSFNWKSSFVLIYYKSEDGYPNFFLFSYLLLISLYTNSTYIILLKKFFRSVLFSKFLPLFVLRAIIFNSIFWYSLTGYIHQNHRNFSWYPSYFEKMIAVDLTNNIINFFFILSIYLLANTDSTLKCYHAISRASCASSLFLMKNSFWLLRFRTTSCNKLNRWKTQVLAE